MINNFGGVGCKRGHNQVMPVIRLANTGIECHHINFAGEIDRVKLAYAKGILKASKRELIN